MIVKKIKYLRSYATVYFEDRMVKLTVSSAASILEGDDISEEELENLLLKSDGESAKASAIRLINRGDKSEYELRVKLKKRGFKDESIEKAIACLYEADLLNDERYARVFTETMRLKNKSRREIESRLRRAGVDSGIIEDALSEYSSLEEEERLDDYVSKRTSYYLNGDKSSVDKFIRHLISKGFDYGKAIEAINRHKQKEDENDTH